MVSQCRGELFQAAEGGVQRRFLLRRLAQERQNAVACANADIKMRIGARYVGAELDEILGALIQSEGFANLARGLELFSGGYLRTDARDGGEHIDGGIVSGHSQIPRKHDVSVQNAA